jgi:hypothetical protein
MTRCLLVLMVFSAELTAQAPRGVIFRYAGSRPERIFQEYAQRNQESVTIKLISTSLQAYLAESSAPEALYSFCASQPSFFDLSYDVQVSQRKRPNDPRLSEQYALNAIKAFEAWDITTGGKNWKGEDIVIGLIDDGFDISHEDLTANIYENPDEIAGDGKDNDANGFADDVHGWNQRSKNGSHDVKSHGTNVIGVMGAKGNNTKGITGVNWDVRLLPVTIGTFVSDVIAGLDYLLTERKLYNASGGTKGSNIQVVNYSGGLSNAFAASQPIWCSMYDKMGLEGILNVGATTNDGINVEEEGDLPSLCTSPYLLIVNSTTQKDQIDPVTGYGSASVDISAPGERILTCDVKAKGNYKTESGTSLSTPIVAGAAALIHSIKCEAFHSLVVDDPGTAVIELKNILMQCSDKLPSLAGKTVSEGRLNLFTALQCAIDNFCDKELAPKGDLAVISASFSGHELIVRYNSPDQTSILLKIVDAVGRECYSSTFFPPVFGKKEISLALGRDELPGMFYYVTLISGGHTASKGFTVQDPR